MAATIVILVVLLAAVAAGVVHFRKTMKSGCCGAGGGTVKIRPDDRNRSHYPYRTELKITGMHCDNCVTHVQNALNSLDGVSASVHLHGGKAVVLSKTPPDIDAYCDAVRQAGYEAVATVPVGQAQV